MSNFEEVLESMFAVVFDINIPESRFRNCILPHRKPFMNTEIAVSKYIQTSKNRILSYLSFLMSFPKSFWQNHKFPTRWVNNQIWIMDLLCIWLSIAHKYTSQLNLTALSPFIRFILALMSSIENSSFVVSALTFYFLPFICSVRRNALFIYQTIFKRNETIVVDANERWNKTA